MTVHCRRFLLALSAFAVLTLTQCGKQNEASKDSTPVLRIGFFPNITHAPALVGYAETNAKGKAGWFESRTGAKIEWYPFYDGPSAIEALLAGTIDATYTGPNPAINGYTRAKGTDVRVLSGVARGGAALVVHKKSGLKTPTDFKGKKIGTPQLGGTQDVAVRAWLVAGGLAVKQSGGDASVTPTANPDQLGLFMRHELDAVWTAEPWVSRLELEADGEVLVEQKDVVTTILVGSTKALKTKPALLKAFVAAHKELTTGVAAAPAWAKTAVFTALKSVTHKEYPATLLDHAWPRLTFSSELSITDFTTIQHDAKSVGLLPAEADLGQFLVQ